MNSPAGFSELRTAYDLAFEHLREEIRTLEELRGAGVEKAGRHQDRVREAEASYRRSRDELAEFLIEHQRRSDQEEHACMPT